MNSIAFMGDQCLPLTMARTYSDCYCDDETLTGYEAWIGYRGKDNFPSGDGWKTQLLKEYSLKDMHKKAKKHTVTHLRLKGKPNSLKNYVCMVYSLQVREIVVLMLHVIPKC